MSESKLWRHLWDDTVTIQASPLDAAILEIASNVVTTNYDYLFEQASGSEGLGWSPVSVLKETATASEKRWEGLNAGRC
jgi:hypothetical protein